MERIDIAGIAIDTEIAGTGPPLLFLHGGDYVAQNRAFLDRLAARFRVIAPRHPGFGHTPRPAWFRSVHDIAYLYLDLLDRLDLNDTVLVGSSLGGWIALEMAVRSQSRIGRLVLIDSVGVKFGDREQRDIADIYALAGRRGARAAPLPTRRVTSPITAGSTTARRWRSRATARRPRSTAGSRTCTTRRSSIGCTGSRGPALVLWGEKDGIVAPSYGERLAAALPNASFETDRSARRTTRRSNSPTRSPPRSNASLQAT